MKTWKNFIWVIAIAVFSAILVTVSYFYFKPAKSTKIENRILFSIDSLHHQHTSDSLKYNDERDSLMSVITGLSKISEEKGKEIVRLRKLYELRKAEIVKLEPVAAVEYFSELTADTAVILSDSTVRTSLQAIDNANCIFVERDGYKVENDLLIEHVNILDSLSSKQLALIALKDTRIVSLTNDYYASQKIINNQLLLIDKQKKKIRRKNAKLWIFGGVAAVLTFVTVVQ